MWSNEDEHKDLPLAPETILKHRHDLYELRARREAKYTIKPRFVKRKEQGPQLIKPESLLTHAKSRHDMMKRCRRVRAKGMQKRASKDKVIEIKKATDDAAKGNKTNNIGFKHATNSVRSKFAFCFRVRDNAGMPPAIKTL